MGESTYVRTKQLQTSRLSGETTPSRFQAYCFCKYCVPMTYYFRRKPAHAYISIISRLQWKQSWLPTKNLFVNWCNFLKNWHPSFHFLNYYDQFNERSLKELTFGRNLWLKSRKMEEDIGISKRESRPRTLWNHWRCWTVLISTDLLVRSSLNSSWIISVNGWKNGATKW